MLNTKTSDKIFKKAIKLIPGGVNSPVRAFKSVNRNPLFIKKANGAYIYDVDENKYIDYVCSWGPLILGHNHPVILQAVTEAAQNGLSFGAPCENEVVMASLMTELVPSLEMVRMVNSGTEATMSALRLARAFTGRDKIIKFAGCYHGHSDSLLVKGGSGLISCPDSVGVSANAARDTLVADYNNIDSVAQCFKNHPSQIAAIIIEPIAANMGVVPANKKFLAELRNICDTEKTILIFDEVITGFRIALGGAGEYFGIKSDLICFGKIIGGGIPCGAYGGRSDIMGMVAPSGAMYQAGTLSGNPIAMAAGIAALTYLRDHKEVYKNIDELSTMLFSGLHKITQKHNSDCTVNYSGSIGSLFFTKNDVTDFKSALKSDTAKFAEYFNYMLEHNIYSAPSQFEAMFISSMHSKSNIEYTLETAENFFKEKK
jgi:glutamate-1-semialdehyde 2,1-aminomutase